LRACLPSSYVDSHDRASDPPPKRGVSIATLIHIPAQAPSNGLHLIAGLGVFERHILVMIRLFYFLS